MRIHRARFIQSDQSKLDPKIPMTCFMVDQNIVLSLSMSRNLVDCQNHRIRESKGLPLRFVMYMRHNVKITQYNARNRQSKGKDCSVQYKDQTIQKTRLPIRFLMYGLALCVSINTYFSHIFYTYCLP